MANNFDKFEAVVVRCINCRSFARHPTTNTEETIFVYFCPETSTIRFKAYCDKCKIEFSCDVDLADMIGRKIDEWGIKDDILDDIYIDVHVK